MVFDFFKRSKEKPKGEAPIEQVGAASEEASEASATPWFARLKQGLSKSSSKITSGIASVLTQRKLDADTLEELEDVLITADLGVKTAQQITSELARTRMNKDVTAQEIEEALAEQIAAILEPVAKPLDISGSSPQVILVCGVNGNGKTTTIGKLAKQYKAQGKTILLVACDTFRAAAVEQLSVWAERAECEIITGAENADPASVAYKALEKAKNEAIDIVLIDTAGRLQNKKNLMEELTKITRVIKKADEAAPHHTLLVLDATTGQNALSQAKLFGEAAQLTGLIVTKLDGTAKGGIVVALAREFGLPVHAVGVGEAIDDLHDFNATDFARNLVGAS